MTSYPTTCNTIFFNTVVCAVITVFGSLLPPYWRWLTDTLNIDWSLLQWHSQTKISPILTIISPYFASDDSKLICLAWWVGFVERRAEKNWTVRPGDIGVLSTTRRVCKCALLLLLYYFLSLLREKNSESLKSLHAISVTDRQATY